MDHATLLALLDLGGLELGGLGFGGRGFLALEDVIEIQLHQDIIDIIIVLLELAVAINQGSKASQQSDQQEGFTLVTRL